MNKAKTERYRVRHLMGLGALAGAFTLAATLVFSGVVRDVIGPAYAHKEHHQEDELQIFEEIFMEYVILGDRLFHGDAELEEEMGVNLSDTGMACAMCHPFAKDTNPHEFPKFQEQMGEFSTLAGMTNWCIDNPNQGEEIDVDSEAMKALEAYQYWSHDGSVLNPGVH